MFQQTVIIGNVGRQPEVRFTQGGDKCANFSVATTNKSGDKEYTEWHRCVVWKKAADIIEKYVQKGTLLLVVGELRTREWTGNDGVKKYTTELHVAGYGHTVRVLARGRDNPDQSGQMDPDQGYPAGDPDLDDEIPL